jgi:hypothetical protein
MSRWYIKIGQNEDAVRFLPTAVELTIPIPISVNPTEGREWEDDTGDRNFSIVCQTLMSCIQTGYQDGVDKVLSKIEKEYLTPYSQVDIPEAIDKTTRRKKSIKEKNRIQDEIFYKYSVTGSSPFYGSMCTNGKFCDILNSVFSSPSEDYRKALLNRILESVDSLDWNARLCFWFSARKYIHNIFNLPGFVEDLSDSNKALAKISLINTFMLRVGFVPGYDKDFCSDIVGCNRSLSDSEFRIFYHDNVVRDINAIQNAELKGHLLSEALDIIDGNKNKKERISALKDVRSVVKKVKDPVEAFGIELDVVEHYLRLGEEKAALNTAYNIVQNQIEGLNSSYSRVSAIERIVYIFKVFVGYPELSVELSKAGVREIKAHGIDGNNVVDLNIFEGSIYRFVNALWSAGWEETEKFLRERGEFKTTDDIPNFVEYENWMKAQMKRTKIGRSTLEALELMAELEKKKFYSSRGK